MRNIINQLSPRFSISYMITPKISLNTNSGIYKQLPAYTTLGYRNAQGVLENKENNLKYISVTHYITGLEYKYNPKMLKNQEKNLE